LGGCGCVPAQLCSSGTMGRKREDSWQEKKGKDSETKPKVGKRPTRQTSVDHDSHRPPGFIKRGLGGTPLT